jgi:hypothetical protein
MARLDLESINNLINNKIKESLNLDYKRELDEYNDEIAKDVSAFANANGGKIIYGIDEKDGLPNSINWINSKGVKEKVENIILTKIQPEIKGYDIYSIENPDNHTQAIFVVDIPESPDAPHMANHRYYIRRNFKSEYMEDSEVKNAIFRKGLRKALENEINQNIDLANKIYECIDKYTNYGANDQILIIPFHIEAWKSFVNSGMLFILKDSANALVEVYNIIHEINFLIDTLRYGNYGNNGIRIATIDYPYGGNISFIIREKINKLKPILQKIKFD